MSFNTVAAELNGYITVRGVVQGETYSAQFEGNGGWCYVTIWIKKIKTHEEKFGTLNEAINFFEDTIGVKISD